MERMNLCCSVRISGVSAPAPRQDVRRTIVKVFLFPVGKHLDVISIIVRIWEVVVVVKSGQASFFAAFYRDTLVSPDAPNTCIAKMSFPV